MTLFNRLKRGVATVLGEIRNGARRVRSSNGWRRDSGGASRGAYVQLTALAWPITIAMISDTMMGLVDTKLVAALGKEALGGVGVATTLMFVMYSMVFGFMRGVKVRASHAVGEGCPEQGVAFGAAGAVLGVAVGLATWALARDAGAVFTWMGVAPEMVRPASGFLAARTLGAPAICVVSALSQWRQGMGDTRSPMVIGIAGNVLNAGLAYSLIHGHLGLPKLGVVGAGYGTAIAEWLEAIALVALLLRERSRAKRTGLSMLRFGTAVRMVSEIGLPTGLQFGLEAVSFTTFTAILGGLGAHEIAAHQVAMAVVRTSFLPGVAIAEAGSVLVGNALGARRLGDADRAAKAAITLAVAFMTACGLVFAMMRRTIVGFFTDEADVAHVAARLLLVAAVFQALDAVTIVLRGALRAAKDVRVVAAVGISCAWFFIPTAAWLLGRICGLGALGGWLGFVGETTVAALIFSRRWKVGRWRDAYSQARSTSESSADLTPMPLAT